MRTFLWIPAALLLTPGCADDIDVGADGAGTGAPLPTDDSEAETAMGDGGTASVDGGATSNSASGSGPGATASSSTAAPDSTTSNAMDTGPDTSGTDTATVSGGDASSGTATTATGSGDATTTDATTTDATTTGEASTDATTTDGAATDGATSGTTSTGATATGATATSGTTSDGSTTADATETSTGGGGGNGLDLGGPPACTTPGEWLLETIAVGTGNDLDIAVGASGTPQVVWGGDFSGAHAYRDSTGQWQVDPTINIGGEAIALAVNPTGVGDEAELPFAVNFPINAGAGVWSRRRDADGTWTGLQLDTTSNLSSGEIDLAYAPDGTLHAAYSIFSGQLVHAAASPDAPPSLANWDDEVVDATIFFTSGVGISVDATSIHIAYAGGGDLRYARRDGAGAFVLSTIDDERPCRAPAITLDSLGNPGVSYLDDDAGDLRFAYEDGGWSHEFVDGAVGTVGRDSGLGISASGQVVIASWDFTGLDVEAAVRDDPSVGAWGLQTVDFADVVGAWTSAEMDSFGGLHVAYVKAAPAPNEIRYAYRCPG